MASTTIVDSYSVGSENKPIKLKVSLTGSMEIGKSTVRLDKNKIGDYDDSFEVVLGAADDVMGSILYIDTTESYIDKNTSGTTDFKISLEGGPQPYVNSRSQSVAPGGYVLYTTEIALIP